MRALRRLEADHPDVTGRAPHAAAASVPMVIGPMPAATAEAPPPVEPPGVRLVSHGLRVVPRRRFVVNPVEVISGTLVVPSTMAPDPSRRSTATALWSGTNVSNILTPSVERTPAIQMASLIVTGTPCSGPRSSPRRTAASARFAADRARSGSGVMNAFRTGSNRSIRASTASTTSTGEDLLPTYQRRQTSRRQSAERVPIHMRPPTSGSRAGARDGSGCPSGAVRLSLLNGPVESEEPTPLAHANVSRETFVLHTSGCFRGRGQDPSAALGITVGACRSDDSGPLERTGKLAGLNRGNPRGHPRGVLPLVLSLLPTA